MKKFNWFLVVTLLLITACQTNASGAPTWKEDGTLTSANGTKIQLEIQSIYGSLNHLGLNYLAGFKIDKEGNNYPYIAQVSDDLSSTTYWPFIQIPNDIFVYNARIHTATMNGQVYSLQDGKWNLIEQQFPRESRVVYSDHQEKLILCYPASMEKSAAHNGGCRSIDKTWKLEFVWFSIVPKVCKGELYIVEENSASKIFKRVDLATGKVLDSIQVNTVIQDICAL